MKYRSPNDLYWTSVERRMKQALEREPSDKPYARKDWLLYRTKDGAVILRGVRRLNTMSGDTRYSFERIHVSV